MAMPKHETVADHDAACSDVGRAALAQVRAVIDDLVARHRPADAVGLEVDPQGDDRGRERRDEHRPDDDRPLRAGQVLPRQYPQEQQVGGGERGVRGQAEPPPTARPHHVRRRPDLQALDPR